MRNNSARSKGFTLIELLIVIALLGALAVGLLATIDPFEQLKKGRDTSQRNTVSELYNAFLRYYSIKGYFPWNSSGTPIATSGQVASDFGSSISSLIQVGELKDRFIDLAGSGNLNLIYINADTTGTQMAVCFMPESKSFQGDANTIYNSAGLTTAVGYGTSCSGGGGTALNCFYCIQ